jgi:aconitate hydratase
MIQLQKNGVYLVSGKPVPAEEYRGVTKTPDEGREKTLAYKILRAHDSGTNPKKLRLKFDALVSHDITYVGIIQTARASGMTRFPIPYALTNCHNSLCAVGGTINEDDHFFGLSAAKRYGGIFVPANVAVIHQYAREALSGCGKMILGSDSHTRYGCYGTLGVGEGGGELAKQLLENTYDVDAPEVVLVWVEGTVPHGVGPHDVAVALVGATFPDGFVKNKILEFAGPGIGALSMDFRIGVDVMTTETSCLSSVWTTDGKVQAYYENIGRPADYKKLDTEDGAYYDSMVTVNLSHLESMIALPFHPSKAYSIHELQEDPERILKEIEDACNGELGGKVTMDLRRNINDKGQLAVEQGVIVGCSGGMYENISEAADILAGKSVGNGYFSLSVYPSSAPIGLAMTKDGIAAALMEAGALIKPAFCGPCFGAGDTPANNTLSIRHATRNFANREGSKPGAGQIAAVALMDARSIAATAINGGILTAATDIDYAVTSRDYKYDPSVYDKRVYNGWGKPDPSAQLRFGPNIADWPEMHRMDDGLLVKLCAVLRDAVTPTAELIPSARDVVLPLKSPRAVRVYAVTPRARIRGAQQGGPRARGGAPGRRSPNEIKEVLARVGGDAQKTTVGSCVFARKPGDGSAPRAGGLLPEGPGRLGEHLLRVRHEALPLKLHQLGPGPFHPRSRRAV